MGVVVPLAFLVASIAGQEPGFEGAVRPLIEARCVACHGPTRRAGGLRLDRREEALPVVLPPADGQPSPLLARVRSADPDERMPQDAPPLSSEELELLERWVAAGAPWPAEPTHWAYVAPRRVEPPAQRVEPLAQGGAADAIDAWVLAGLAEAGLEPAPRADRATLLRRASLDLCGLPPSLEALDRFLLDERPDAWARAVDALLASPAHAEHMARLWLDLARYADTHGYEKDEPREMWRWRDWVIEAYARDLPFDRFTVLQLAGDLLPDAGVEERLATGFHRNTMLNQEGGVDDEEFRVAAVVDRVATTASVWLGTTLACAQCHDHPHDPFTQREFYELFAFFDGTEDGGRLPEPVLLAPSAMDEARAARRARALASAREGLSRAGAEVAPQFAEWRAAQAAALLRWTPLVPTGVEARAGSQLALEGSVLRAAVAGPDADSYVLRVPGPLRGVQSLRLVALPDRELPRGGPGCSPGGNFVLNELRVVVHGEGRPRAVGVRHALADHSQAGVRWSAAALLDPEPGNGWAIGGAVGQAHQLALALTEPLEVGAQEQLELELVQRHGRAHRLGRLRIDVSTQVLPPEATLHPPALEPLLRAAALDAAGERALRERHRATAPELAALRARVRALEEPAPQPAVLVMAERATPRETRVLRRGSHLAPGERVARATPSALHAFPADAPRDRLGLARWLVDPQNPLTARVAANRLWAQLFGAGLVHSLDDFGAQGERPSHPELLDLLALDLVAGGWSQRALLRRLVSTEAYRRGAALRAGDLELDPHNRLLARASRRRLDAEELRDAALSAAGLLSPRVGGPSVFPPQPEGVWGATYSGARWRTSEDSDRHRRGLYTFWRRTSPYPSFTLLDAPSRETSCARRARTDTPLQALVLWNDPAFVEAAAALAARTLREGGADDAARAAYAFRQCTSRAPEAWELARLLALLAEQRAHDAARPEGARARVAGAGEGADELELAAWVVVANLLLNLDEALSRP